MVPKNRSESTLKLTFLRWSQQTPWGRRRTCRMVPVRRAAIGLFCIISGAPSALGAGEAGGVHIYCKRTGGAEYSGYDSYYYTAVFEGDYGYTLGHENEFYDFLSGNDPEGFFRHSYCFYESTRPEAQARLGRDIEDAGRKGYRVVRTNWAPSGPDGARVDSSFAEQAIRDYRISVPRSPYPVQVCVRDHQCEDGDRVRVSVNGSVLLRGEIFNAWDCRSASLREGRSDIELYAVNGTGYKGDCSYADGNTGELRVTGGDSQTQTWRHRGGKGSRANIVVTVR